jgi:hypothetical protein
MKRLVLVLAFSVFYAGSAGASWQLIPGKPYDWHSPRSNRKEPCWSIAVEKCARERSWKEHLELMKKVPQR